MRFVSHVTSFKADFLGLGSISMSSKARNYTYNDKTASQTQAVLRGRFLAQDLLSLLEVGCFILEQTFINE